MKCENCKKNEATYHYRSNINGKITETHLCSECARAAQLTNNISFGTMDTMFDNFFNDGFLTPFSSFRGSLAQRLIPKIDILVDETPAEAKAEAKGREVSEINGCEIDQDMRKRRELNALKHQLDEAVKAENFEKAAELRDKIHAMEKE